jgi:hypothetical protein
MKTEYVYHFESVKLVEVSESGQGSALSLTGNGVIVSLDNGSLSAAAATSAPGANPDKSISLKDFNSIILNHFDDEQGSAEGAIIGLVDIEVGLQSANMQVDAFDMSDGSSLQLWEDNKTLKVLKLTT